MALCCLPQAIFALPPTKDLQQVLLCVSECTPEYESGTVGEEGRRIKEVALPFQWGHKGPFPLVGEERQMVGNLREGLPPSPLWPPILLPYGTV